MRDNRHYLMKKAALTTAIFLSVSGAMPFLLPQAEAGDPVEVTDTANVTWRTTDGTYNFKDGLEFMFTGTEEPSEANGGISVYSQKNNAERVINAKGNLSITQKNGNGVNSGLSSAGAYVFGTKNDSEQITPSQVRFEGDTIRLTGLFDGTPDTRSHPDTYGLYVEGWRVTYAADERNASVVFNNKNTYLTASYQSATDAPVTTMAYALDVHHAAEAVFNSNAYLTTTLNEHGNINGTAVKVKIGNVTFNGKETKLLVTSENKVNGRMSLWGVNAQGPYFGDSSVSATPYELVQFNSPTTDITVTSKGKSGAAGVYTQLGDVNFTNKVKNLSIDVKATEAEGDNNRFARGLFAWNYGAVNNHAENTSITSYSDDPAVTWLKNNALYVYANGHINMDGSRLDIQSQSKHRDVVAIYAYGSKSNLASGGDNVTVQKGNTVNLNADHMTITAIGKDDKPSYAALASASTDTATINVNSDDAGSDQGKTLTVAGNVYSYGGKSAGADALINMNFTNSASSLHGWSYYYNRTGAGILNFKFNNGAVWEMTDNSRVTNLDVNNGGTVDMRADENGYSTLHARNLTGSGGTFKENIDVRSMEADRIYVPGNFTGTQELDIYQKDDYVPGRDTKEGNGLVLATVNGDGTFTSKDREGTLFYTRYDLAHKDSGTDGYETDWYLDRMYHVDPEVKPTPTIEGGTASYGAAYHTWRTELDKLLQRMGELRHNGEKEKGVWARIKGTEIGRNGQFGFENKYQVYELGYDDIAKRDDKVTRYAGFSLSYIDGDTSYHRGSGDLHGGAFSVYSTDIRKSKHYLDLIAKVGVYKSEYTAYGSNGDRVKGDFDNTGVSLSAEYGRKNDLKHHWYVEPQAQLVLGYFDGDSYTTSNGVRVHQDGIHSAVGRIGFNLGKDVGPKSIIYAKANLMHEFGGNAGVTMTDASGRVHIDQDYSDTWFTYGLGAAFQTGRETHFYCDVERSAGSDFHKDWQWNVGFRYNF